MYNWGSLNRAIRERALAHLSSRRTRRSPSPLVPRASQHCRRAEPARQSEVWQASSPLVLAGEFPRTYVPAAHLDLGDFCGGMARVSSVPRPEFADLSHADRVLDWMRSVHETGHTSAVALSQAQAVRLAEARPAARSRSARRHYIHWWGAAHRNAPPVYRIGRDGACFPVMRRPRRGCWARAAQTEPQATICISIPIEWRVIPGSPLQQGWRYCPVRSSALCPFIQAKYFLTLISAIWRG